MIISIQYLRAFSAIIVVIFHCFHTSWGGDQGVGMFFIISGFIMLYLLDKKDKDWKSFIKARFIRVVPLYWLMTTLVLLLGIGYQVSLLRIISSYSFLALGSILPVGWTLTYEFIFYISCTFILWKFTSYKVLYQYLLIFLLLLFEDILLYFLLRYYGFNDFGHYFLFFILGGIVYIIYNINIIIDKYLLYLFMILSVVFIFSYDNGQTIYIVFKLGIPSAVLFYSIIVYEKYYGIKKINSLILLGNSSYSLYLTHYIVLHTLNFNDILLFLISIMVGVLSYKFIELPSLLFLKRKFNVVNN